MKNVIKNINKRSYIFNFILGIAKILVGLFLHFYSFCISAMYNLMLGFSKYKAKKMKSNYTGLFIILSSLLYISYSVFIIIKHLNAKYHMYIGILIAVVTFTEIGVAIYGIIKNKNNLKTKVEKQLNLCSAIIALSLTQQALMSFTNPGKDISLYVGIGGIVFSSITIIIGIVIQISLLKEYNQVRKDNESIIN